MLPSPSSSPRAVLDNSTNFLRPPPNLWFSLPTPPQDRVAKRRAHPEGPPQKRVKLSFDDEGSEGSDCDSDVEMEDVAIARRRARKYTPFERNTRSIMGPTGRYGYQHREWNSIYPSIVSYKTYVSTSYRANAAHTTILCILE